MRKYLFLYSMILAWVLVAAWQFLPLWDKGKEEKPGTLSEMPEKLVVAAYKGDFSALIWIAENKDFFKLNGLDVHIKEYDSGVLTVRDVIEGKADIATSGEFVAVNNLFNYGDLIILSSIARGDAIDLVSRRGSGVQQPSDLIGKRIGLKMRSQAEYELNHFLQRNNIPIDDVQTVDINPMQMEKALLSGDIDAVVVWNPYAYRINEALGENALSWHIQDFPFFFLTITNKNFLESRPSVAKKFLASMNEAASFTRKHNEEARKIVRDRLGYDEPYSKMSWNTLNFKFGLSQTLLLAMESEGRWLISNERTNSKHIPDYTEHFAIPHLKEVNPATVEIIH